MRGDMEEMEEMYKRKRSDADAEVARLRGVVDQNAKEIERLGGQSTVGADALNRVKELEAENASVKQKMVDLLQNVSDLEEDVLASKLASENLIWNLIFGSRNLQNNVKTIRNEKQIDPKLNPN